MQYSKNIKFTVLIENSSATKNLTAQHGLSFYIETENKKILLDAGQNQAFADNAVILNKDLLKIDYAVVSHPHYDHAGGINTFCKINKTAPIYTFWNKKDDYLSTTHCQPGVTARKIGFYIDNTYKSRIKTLDKNKITQLEENIWIVPITVHSYKSPFKNKTLFIRENNSTEKQQDKFTDECMLVFGIKGKSELVVFNSCSHNGVINSIESVNQFFPEKTITTYIGGFHFPWKKEETIAKEDIDAMNELTAYIKKIPNIKLYSGHCTGEKALEYLSGRLNNKFSCLTTGLTITI